MAPHHLRAQNICKQREAWAKLILLSAHESYTGQPDRTPFEQGPLFLQNLARRQRGTVLRTHVVALHLRRGKKVLFFQVSTVLCQEPECPGFLGTTLPFTPFLPPAADAIHN